MSDVTRILSQIEEGDPQAAEKLLPLVYEELRKLAAAKLAQEKPGQTLVATALVHEAYLRLVRRHDGEKERQSDGETEQPLPHSVPPSLCPSLPAFNSRGHFFAAAAEAMRRILVDRARERKSLKRGGDRQRLHFHQLHLEAERTPAEFLALHEALERLEAKDQRKAELVKLRFFAGLTNEQAAEALGISSSTADNDWAYARAWLRLELEKS